MQPVGPLMKEHRTTLDRLRRDHKLSRRVVGALDNALLRIGEVGKEAREKVVERHQDLLLIYPPHIVLEDEEFLHPVMEYSTDVERERILEEESTFDRDLVHQVYGERMAELEGRFKEKEGPAGE
jgi:hemerythrin-like domain-containing protein